jgi:hypothetical protein
LLWNIVTQKFSSLTTARACFDPPSFCAIYASPTTSAHDGALFGSVK